MPLEGFETRIVEPDGVPIALHMAGEGPPLLLLHGFPQNHMCWERVAPELASRNRVIVADLRGYGMSGAPESRDGALYAKRVMARELVRAMVELGHERFDVLGHGRGARVAYRMALDHPDRVHRLGIIEIVPTWDMWASWSAELGLAAYHWTFLAQPWPLPERLIGADPGGWLDHTLASWTGAGTLEPFSEAALASYRAQIADPARLHAMCADYRAGATVDRALDAADLAEGNRIRARTRLLFAQGGFPARTGDPLAHWRKWCDDIDAMPVESGHFVMEEAPEAVISAFAPFFGDAGD